MGFEVVAADIRDAARQLKAAADGVRGADPSDDLGPVASALRGSRSAAAATTLESAWQQRFRDWSDDAEAESTAMVASADTYDASDHRAGLRARRLGVGYL
jgi:hypothetical protein